MPLPSTLPDDYNVISTHHNNSLEKPIKLFGLHRYDTIKKIGSGNFGCAFLVKDKKKGIPKEETYKVLKQICVGPIDPGETVDAMQEARLLSKLHHSSIVQFFESFIDGQFFCIALEYCEGGDLEETIKQQKDINSYFPEEQIINWFGQLLSGVDYMHGKRVLHRDIKTRNIFLKNNEIKIGDFGISRILMGTSDRASTFVGTPYYMSPEVLNHEEYDEKCDIWSLGVVLYRMCCHIYPFDGSSLMAIMLKIVSKENPSLNDHYSRALNNILEKMFDRDPARRPKAKHLLEHHLFHTKYASRSTSPPLSNLTARDRMRLKKQKEADEKIERLKQLAKEKRMDNERIRRQSKEKHLKTSIFNVTAGRNNMELKSTSKQLPISTTTTTQQQQQDDDDDNEVTLVSNLTSVVRKDDVIIPSTSSSMKEERHDVDGEDVEMSTDELIQTLIRDGVIPEDEELANTLYSLHDDFEDDYDDDVSQVTSSVSEEVGGMSMSSADYHEMLDRMEEALNEETSGDVIEEDLINSDDTQHINHDFVRTEHLLKFGAANHRPFNTIALDNLKEPQQQTVVPPQQQEEFSKIAESVVDQRISKMRHKCEEMLGVEVFNRAYECISRIKFDSNMVEQNEAVAIELAKIVPDTSKCMDLEQLVFLEQEKVRGTTVKKQRSSSHS